MSLKIAVVVVLLGISGAAEDRAPSPVSCSQLLSWFAAGIPNERLIRLADQRGTTIPVDESSAAILAKAGASAGLLKELRHLTPQSTTTSDCPAELGQAAEFVHHQNFDQAEPPIRKLLSVTPDDSDLHLALGYIRLQQRDVDEAFDAYADAKDLNPDFPEIHNGLSEVFYRSNDAENAIAEARTALSIDPQNAEGYRYLGLGLYAAENYTAAVHAFKESVVRDPNRAETFYDMGLAQSAGKYLTAAADSYRQALALDPNLLEARTGLQAVLHQIGSDQTAVSQKPGTDSPARR